MGFLGHASMVGDLARINTLQDQVGLYEEALIELVLAVEAGKPRRIKRAITRAVMYLDEFNQPDPIADQWYRDAVTAGYSVRDAWVYRGTDA